MKKMLMLMLAVTWMCGCAQVAKPAGRWAIGSRTWVAAHEPEVIDVLADEPGTVRKLPVKAYFPVDGKGGELSDNTTYTPAGNPVLVFVHGTGSELDAHSYLAEELASRGWVVLTAAHPGLARTADYPKDPSRGMSKKLQELLAKSAFGDPFVRDAVELLKSDVRLMVRSAAAELPGLSLDRISYGGHSMGAVVTMGVCREPESNCAAFVNLDGPPLADLADAGDGSSRIEPMPVAKPMLIVTSELMTTGEKTKDLWTSIDAQARLGDAPMLSARLLKAGHLDLSDAPMDMGHVLIGLLFGEGAAGSIEPVRAVDATKAVVARFLERYGQCDAGADVLQEVGTWPELEVRDSRRLDELPPACR